MYRVPPGPVAETRVDSTAMGKVNGDGDPAGSDSVTGNGRGAPAGTVTDVVSGHGCPDSTRSTPGTGIGWPRPNVRLSRTASGAPPSAAGSGGWAWAPPYGCSG